MILPLDTDIIIAKEAITMLYLKRKIDAFLAEWKAKADRKPLIVKGPRQVGKPSRSSDLGTPIIRA